MMTSKTSSSLRIKSGLYTLLFFSLALLLSACSSISNTKKTYSASQQAIPFSGYEQLTKEEQILADSILGYALDHEALYSLLADLKPMSSIGFALSYPLPEDFIPVAKDYMILQEASAMLKQYQAIRPDYVNKEGKLGAIKLFRDWWKESRTH